ncbi:MAG TPA: hypothetical protein VGF42_05225 [Caulobacteraceae bacterium]|jgi:uncharacterized protein (DUF1800 family)
MTIDLNASIAVTRFGLGARPGEIDRARVDPRAFLLDQIRTAGAPSLRRPHPIRLSALANFAIINASASKPGRPANAW